MLYGPRWPQTYRFTHLWLVMNNKNTFRGIHLLFPRLGDTYYNPSASRRTSMSLRLTWPTVSQTLNKSTTILKCVCVQLLEPKVTLHDSLKIEGTRD